MNANSEKSLATLAEEVHTFFRKGAHDIQNLLQMVHLLLATDRESDREHTLGLLNELEEYYADKISRLRHSFEELRSIRTGYTPITEIDIPNLITVVLDEMSNVLPKDILIDVSVDPRATLTYSEGHVRNALRALIDNAVRYKGNELTISINVDSVGEDVRILVRDNGIGIDMSRYRDQLFQPFVRYTDQGEGQGISLHLIKTMAEQYGGHIEIASQLNEGTTVTLYLISQSHRTYPNDLPTENAGRP